MSQAASVFCWLENSGQPIRITLVSTQLKSRSLASANFFRSATNFASSLNPTCLVTADLLLFVFGGFMVINVKRCSQCLSREIDIGG